MRKVSYIKMGILIFSLLLSWQIAGENRLDDINARLVLKNFLIKQNEATQTFSVEEGWSGENVMLYKEGDYLPKLATIRDKILSFKTVFFINESLKKEALSLLLYPTTHPYIIYLNGVVIFKNTRFSTNLPTYTDIAHAELLSMDLLHYGSNENSLVIQIFPKYYDSPLPRVMVTSLDYAEEWVFWRNLFCISVLQGSFILAFTITFLFFMLFIFFNFKEKLFLWATLLCIAFCMSYSNMTFQYYSLNALGIEKVARIGFPFCTIFLTLFIMEFTNVIKKGKNIVTYILLGSGVVCLVHLIFQNNVYDLKNTFTYYLNFLITPLLLFNIILLLIMLIKKKHIQAFYFLISFGFIVVSSIHDMYYFIIGVAPYAWLVPYGYVTLIVSIFFFLAVRTANDYFASIRQAQTIQRSQNVFKKFVPNEFIRILNKDNILDVKLGNQIERDMTVLFLDIRSFATLSENMSPDDTFKFINTFLSRMSPHIRANNGFIDKYVGDGIVALFPHAPDDAVNAAISMRNELAYYNESRVRSGYIPIDIGIGINTGRLILGIVGEEERMEGTVISDAVNVASRIEQATKVSGAGILISHVTFQRMNDPTQYMHRFLGRIKVKGKEEIISIFEILNKDIHHLIRSDLDALNAFNKGVLAFFNKDFTYATIMFDKAMQIDQDDKCAFRFHELSSKYEVEGVTDDWDGVDRYY